MLVKLLSYLCGLWVGKPPFTYLPTKQEGVLFRNVRLLCPQPHVVCMHYSAEVDYCVSIVRSSVMGSQPEVPERGKCLLTILAYSLNIHPIQKRNTTYILMKFPLANINFINI